MLSRRAIFNLSVAAAVVVYALFFAVAPQVTMLRSHAAPQDLMDRFQVHLRDDLPLPRPPAPVEPAEQVVASRPGQIRDLIERSEELLQPEDLGEITPAEVPGLDQRLADAAPEREYDLERDEQLSRRVDARIIEIAQRDARSNIEVVRRLVRPSPDRLIREDELPALRSSLAPDDAPIRLRMPGRGLLAESMENPESLAPTLQREDSLPPLPAQTAVTRTQESQAVARAVPRAPLSRAVEEARDESQYIFMDDVLDVQLDSYVVPGDPLGYFRVRIVPRADRVLEVLPKDVTFIVDASASIPQFKLNTTAHAVGAALRQLNPEDMFNVVLFRSSPSFFQPRRVPATAENIAQATRFLTDAESRGMTDLYEAILPVLQEAPREGVPGIALVISDGRPTSGLQDARMLINSLTADNRLTHSIYSYGGGNTVDRYLLDLLAYRNKGQGEVVPSVGDIRDGLPRFFSMLRSPLLVDLRADYGRIDASEVFPRILPDFYEGQVVTLYGRFNVEQDEEIVMQLTGQAERRRKALIFRANLRDAVTGDREIARNWAFQKSYGIIGDISERGEQPELLAQLRQLAQQYNIRTAYTD